MYECVYIYMYTYVYIYVICIEQLFTSVQTRTDTKEIRRVGDWTEEDCSASQQSRMTVPTHCTQCVHNAQHAPIECTKLSIIDFPLCPIVFSLLRFHFLRSQYKMYVEAQLPCVQIATLDAIKEFLLKNP